MPLSQQPKKAIIVNDTTTVLELYPQEVRLLMALRKRWRFGEVTILTKEGIPYRIVRVQESIDLNNALDFKIT